MKRLLLVPAALLLTLAAFGQSVDGSAGGEKRCVAGLDSAAVAKQDRELIRRADFSGLVVKEAAPDSANASERALWAVRRQLTGRDLYEPANYMFLRPAVKELGFVPAAFALSDRILRDTRLGTVRAIPDPEDGRIHEGPEAYNPCRKVDVQPLVSGAAAPATSGLRLSNVSTPDAASKWVSKDYDFVQYLIENDLKSDARTLVFGDGFHPSDTLSFLRGWSLYQLKELEPSRDFLLSVPSGSAFYDKAFFYSNAISAHLGDYSTPAEQLDTYSGPYAELKGVQLAGLALLRDDPEAFKRAAASFSYNDFALEKAEREFDEIFKSRYETPMKSPLLAAAASAVVPGLGKVYAGQLGEGISSFLVTGAMGAITAEHWIKDGPKSWKTIVPGVLTAILYIGNIYGSYVSVSIYNNTLYDAQETTVLYNVHIPLRSVFK